MVSDTSAGVALGPVATEPTGEPAGLAAGLAVEGLAPAVAADGELVPVVDVALLLDAEPELELELLLLLDPQAAMAGINSNRRVKPTMSRPSLRVILSPCVPNVIHRLELDRTPPLRARD
ncbi:MAG TPA: hypothetical protein VKU87_03695 [Thermomicrobiaceae bacterium]|nr:hypothetical protein [Thermomicrobiaceae bacterium]